MSAPQIITLGIGPRSTIGYFLTFGLGRFTVGVAPSSRTYTVPLSGREFESSDSDRTNTVGSSSRTLNSSTNPRSYTVPRRD